MTFLCCVEAKLTEIIMECYDYLLCIVIFLFDFAGSMMITSLLILQSPLTATNRSTRCADYTDLT